ncbi:hypothetical protein [Asticcacaulis benevestitus]|uniref:Uncharacterized protein n=1 Tax=Asticcacaulis benevestitus DSM 16100 = ATCC BAA-896 TaxID=1121022 RepID=V4RTM5_9CAUL|nr:hypothetical protein [Asticcacaulis benevestitus]ESQ94518.1 hypothetical protein ABENE_00055 [Asticcacaulis benevestitus DSM 16100 = ATCC BAA-896]
MTSNSFELRTLKAHMGVIATHTKEISTMTTQVYTATALAAGTLFMIVALITLGL